MSHHLRGKSDLEMDFSPYTMLHYGIYANLSVKLQDLLQKRFKFKEL